MDEARYAVSRVPSNDSMTKHERDNRGGLCDL